jgi:hypothetical protein
MYGIETFNNMAEAITAVVPKKQRHLKEEDRIQRISLNFNDVKQ